MAGKVQEGVILHAMIMAKSNNRNTYMRNTGSLAESDQFWVVVDHLVGRERKQVWGHVHWHNNVDKHFRIHFTQLSSMELSL